MSTRKWTKYLMAVLLCLVMSAPAFAAWDGSVDTKWYEDNRTATEYTITTPAQLAGLAVLVSGDGALHESFDKKIIRLSADIDLGGKPWTPIGVGTATTNLPFSGTFHGGGHTVSGLSVNALGMYGGLFGLVGAQGTVLDVRVSGTVTGDYTVAGGVVGSNYGTVVSCRSSCTVGGKGAAGGVVGGNWGTVRNCFNSGAISGILAGGVVGENLGLIMGCVNTGDITGSAANSNAGMSGGVAGYHVDTGSDIGQITNCANSGKVTAVGSSAYAAAAGGVAGVSHAPIDRCSNTGAVSASGGSANYAGGLAGQNTSTLANSQWLIGKSTGDANNNAVGLDGGTITACASVDVAGLKAAAVITSASVRVPAGSTRSVSAVYPLEAPSDVRAGVGKVADETIAAWSNNALTGLKAGKTTVAVSTVPANSLGGVAASADVSADVYFVAVDSVSLDVSTLSMKPGDTKVITATVSPDSASVKKVSWASDNPSVTVAASGDTAAVLTAISQGSAKITVTTDDGNKTATCNVTVTPEPSPSPSPSPGPEPTPTPGPIHPAKPAPAPSAVLSADTHVSFITTRVETDKAVSGDTIAAAVAEINNPQVKKTFESFAVRNPWGAYEVDGAAIMKRAIELGMLPKGTTSADVLPVWNVPVAPGKIAGFAFTIEKSAPFNLDALKLIKVQNDGGLYELPRVTPGKLADGTWYLANKDGGALSGNTQSAGTYTLVVAVQDGSGHNLDFDTAPGRVMDPAILAETPKTDSPRGPSSSGGCSAGFGIFALFALCPVGINVIRSKK